MKVFFTTLLATLTLSGIAQTNIKFGINHTLGTEPYTTATVGTNSEDDEFTIYRCDYFISGISIAHSGGDDLEFPDTYLFVNASNAQFDLGDHEVGEIESISFYLGIDSATNHSDPTKWPADHALAPKFPAMHWGWEAGYRFVALEGYSGVDFSTNFQVHAVGDQFYQKVTIPTTALEVDGSLVIALNADLTQTIKGIKVSQGPILHGSDGEAITVMGNFNNDVFSSADGVLSVGSGRMNLKMDIYPNPLIDGVVHMSFPEATTKNQRRIEVTTLLGQSVYSQKVSEQTLSFSLDQSGTYIVFVYENDRVVGQEFLVVR